LSILIDTGVFYAFYNKRDIHHLDSICLLIHILEGRYGKPYTTDLVISETYTLLRYRIGHNTAMAFLHALKKSKIEILFIDQDDYEDVVKLLSSYPDRRLSFTDAFILHASMKYDIKYLASYDERSFSGLIQVFGKGYAKALPEEEIRRIASLLKVFK